MDAPAADPSIGGDGIAVITLLAAALIVLAGDWVGPDLMFTTLMATYTACRFITVQQAAAGFGNTSLLAVMALYAAAEGVSQTGGLERIMNHVLPNNSKSLFWVMVRMQLPVIFASAFVNNTPIVALMIPILIDYSRRKGISLKQLLLPLSYASTFGGTCTLIGTSTNLVVAGFQEMRYPDDPQLSSVGIFSIAPFGLTYAAWGLIYVLFFSKWLLPASEPEPDAVMVGLQVPKGSHHAGKTVSEAGLRGLEGLFLVSVSRLGKVFRAVGPDFILEEGDILYFAGDLSRVEFCGLRHGLRLVTSENEEPGYDSVDVEMRLQASMQAPSGTNTTRPSSMDERSQAEAGSVGSSRHGPRLSPLSPATHATHQNGSVHGRDDVLATSPPSHIFADSHGRLNADRSRSSSMRRHSIHSVHDFSSRPAGPAHLLKCIVREEANVKGCSIRDIGFRGRFGAAVVAVRRGKKRLEGRIGDIVLQPKDELVLDTGVGFSQSSPDVTGNFEDMELIDGSKEKEYLTAFVVPKGSRLAGKSIQSAGLRGMPGLFLVYVDKADGTQLHAVPPEYVLQEFDTLWFAGGLQGVAFLLKMPGLKHIDEEHTKKTNVDILERRLVQVVVAPHCHLVGKSVRELRFRTKYDAAIVAVQRRGERLKQKIGDIVLKGGYVLLLDTGEHFLSNYRDDSAFALVSEVEKSSPPKTSKQWLAIGLLTAMIATQVIQSFTHTGKEPFIHLWTAALLTSSLMVATRCMSGKQARQSMDWTVYMTIASAFGISLATENTNVSQKIGEIFINVSLSIGGKIAILSCLYIATGLLSEILTNNAAAALMYPIASAAGDRLGVKPQLISTAIMLGASAAFISPFGYQTQLMVYGAGSYRTIEFVKYGTGIKLWLWLVTTVMLSWDEHIYVIMGLSVAAAAAVILLPLLASILPQGIKDKAANLVSRMRGKQGAEGMRPELVPLPSAMV